MNPEVKKRWVEALRSGEYKQGAGALRTNYYEDAENVRYCCLGVLCDISGLGEWDGSSYMDENSTLPSEVYKWAGLDSYNPRPKGRKFSLAEYNDGVGVKQKTFEEIAKIIEEKF